jgi:hypothetical protein
MAQAGAQQPFILKNCALLANTPWNTLEYPLCVMVKTWLSCPYGKLVINPLIGITND